VCFLLVFLTYVRNTMHGSENIKYTSLVSFLTLWHFTNIISSMSLYIMRTSPNTPYTLNFKNPAWFNLLCVFRFLPLCSSTTPMLTTFPAWTSVSCNTLRTCKLNGYLTCENIKDIVVMVPERESNRIFMTYLC